jgi:hypothetical protein
VGDPDRAPPPATRRATTSAAWRSCSTAR